MSDNELDQRYDFEESEERLYEFWQNRGDFRATADPDSETFVVAIPPPNVTGELHMGHAVNSTLQDVLVRANRMMGKEALWIPGTDHAGIATQNVVEKRMREEGYSMEDVDREQFIDRVWEWKDEYEGRITDQLKRLGASCDWSRQRFTMDPDYVRAINEAFVRLYEKGLIYQGNYIINWCVRCGTSLSDLEVEHREVDGHLWYMNYPIKGEDDHITVATTRPETMLGDTAVAVHPGDERYKEHHGKTAILPIQDREIPIIADHFVDSSFGTGAVKVTPAHDENDYECGRRNDLEVIQVIDEDGRMTDEAGQPFAGMNRFECRQAVVNTLEQQEILEKTEEYDLNQSICYRCDTVLEPYLSNQWFVKMEPLAEKAIESAENGVPEFFPDRWEDVYMDWLENSRDWCISRQLWWGHQIPVWYCEECGEHTASVGQPDEDCSNCGHHGFNQETDVLDTWFSSALWPFATLGWPDQTRDLEAFYPTDVLVTARDIIYLWVARMVITSLEFLNTEPFDDVYINPTILTPDGERMSKSLGTGIDPIELIEDVGADATRFGLVHMTTGKQDIRFSPDKIEESRNLVTKIWNAFRLFYMNIEDGETLSDELPPADQLNSEDRWILSCHHRCREDLREALDDYQFSDIAHVFYHHFWDDVCDWYLEWAKPRLEGDDEQDRETALTVLNVLFQNLLKLLHPVMPFVTEELWQKLTDVQDGEIEAAIINASYPEVEASWIDEQLERDIEVIQNVAGGVRSIRNEMNISPNQALDVRLSTDSEEMTERILRNQKLLTEAANIDSVEVEVDLEKPPRSATFVREDIEGFVPLEDVLDPEDEVERLEKQVEDTSDHLEQVEQKLDNDDFVENAPDDVVQRERDKREELSNELAKLKDNLADWSEQV